MPKTSCTCEKCNVKRNSGIKNGSGQEVAWHAPAGIRWEEYVRRLSEPSAGRARSAFYDMITQAVNNRTRATAWAVDVHASPCEDESEPQGG